MTAMPERAVQEAVALDDPGTAPQAQTHARTREFTAQTASSATTEEVTERDGNRAADVIRGAREGAVKAAERAGTLLSGPSLLSTAPASLADKRRHHHEAAAHFNAPLLRVPRIIWGYLHLLIKMVLHGIDWVTESPVRVAVAVAVYFIVRIWI